jgi:hypothetical protein
LAKPLHLLNGHKKTKHALYRCVIISTKQKQFSTMKTNAKHQVAAFDQVLGHCNALGTKYNPSKDSIKVAALTSLLTSAQASITAVDTAKFNLMQAINARQNVFAPLPGTATRILSVLIASDAPPQVIADVKKLRDKFRSRSGKTARPEDSTNPTTPADSSRGPLSHLDHESKNETFALILDLVKGEPSYKPNEPEFSSARLTTLLATLREKNKAVRNAEVALRQARMAQKAALYSEVGLYGATKRVKRYVMYAFGATSEQYRMINSYSVATR